MQLARPMVRRAASFHDDFARFALREEVQELPSVQAMALDDPKALVRHCQLEHPGGQIHGDRHTWAHWIPPVF